MSLILPKGLPAISSLSAEGIKANHSGEKVKNDLPILHIGLLNLMPNKEETELQIMRLLSVPGFTIQIHLLHPASYVSKSLHWACL